MNLVLAQNGLVILILNCFSIRSSIARVVPVAAILLYALVSLAPGWSPHGSIRSLGYALVQALMYYVVWIGRCEANLQSRTKWMKEKEFSKIIDELSNKKASFWET